MINRLLELNSLDDSNEKSYRANRELCHRVRSRISGMVYEGHSEEDFELEMQGLRFEIAKDMFSYISKISWSDYTQHKQMSGLFKKFSDVPTEEEELAYDEKIRQLNTLWTGLQHQGLDSLYQEWLNSDGGGQGIHKQLPHIKFKKK